MDFFEELKIENVNSETKKIAEMLRNCILEINNAACKRNIPEFRLSVDGKKIQFKSPYEKTEFPANKPIWEKGHEIYSILDTLAESKTISCSIWCCEYDHTDWCWYFEKNMTDELRNYISYKCMIINDEYNMVENYAYNKDYNGEVPLSDGHEIVSDIDIKNWFSDFVCICITPGKGDAFNENSPIVRAINETMDDWCAKHDFYENIFNDKLIEMFGGQSFNPDTNIETLISGLQQLLDIATAQGAEFTIDCADFCSTSLDAFAGLKFCIENNRVVSKSCRF